MISSYYEGKILKKYKTVNDLKGRVPEGYNLYNKNKTFVPPIDTFPWRKTYLFTRQIKVQRGKSTLIILFKKGKMPIFAVNKHASVHFFLHGPRLFQISTEKYGSDPSEMDIKVVTPALTQ